MERAINASPTTIPARLDVIRPVTAVIGLPLLVVWLAPPSWPRWGVMWILAVAIYATCKWITIRRAADVDAPLWQRTAYLFAWPGLDADAFLRPPRRRVIDRPTAAEWWFAGAKTLCGVVLLFTARHLSAWGDFAVGWAGMIGLVFALHFGTFHLLSCGWRNIGLTAPPLMDWPIASASVAEFWGRRWNRAFRDITHRHLFCPLLNRFQPRAALVIGFVTSGLVHELVITIPARGGYGGPTLYFLCQAAALLFERSGIGRRCGLGRGWRGRLFALTATLLPIGLLFPSVFVTRVMAPFALAWGGWQ